MDKIGAIIYIKMHRVCPLTKGKILIKSYTDLFNMKNLNRIELLENLEKINWIIRKSDTLEEMMSDVLNEMLNIFRCDRAWILFPCNPAADHYTIPMECTRQEYPGAMELNMKIPMTPEQADIIRMALESSDPLEFNYESGISIPNGIAEKFNIRSMIVTAIFPKTGDPWLLGLHQCSYKRVWDEYDRNLLKETGWRLADSLSSLLFLDKLKDSEEKFRLMIEYSPYPVRISDENDKIYYVNRHFTKLFGYTREDIPDITSWFMKAYPDEEYRSMVKNIWSKIKDHKLLVNENNRTHEFKVTCKDGTVKIIDFKAVHIGSSILVMMNDLTRMKIAQQMLVQTEKMVTVGGLAAGMAHEINNPLSIIINGIQALMMRLSPDLKKNRETASKLGTDLETINSYLEERNILKYLRAIGDAGKRAAEIVSNMLNFSRKSETQKKSAHINRLIEKTIEIASQYYDLKRGYDFKNFNIIKDFSRDIPLVKCFPLEIEQVLLNIFKNSIQALEKKLSNKKFIPEIKIKTSFVENYVKIEISDNGSGINKKSLTHIFESFYTTKKEGAGTGLGLPISYHIITNNHNGSIECESQIGEGTKFTIKLPV